MKKKKKENNKKKKWSKDISTELKPSMLTILKAEIFKERMLLAKALQSRRYSAHVQTFHSSGIFPYKRPMNEKHEKGKEGVS